MKMIPSIQFARAAAPLADPRSVALCDAAAPACEFAIELATGRADEPAFRARWRELVAASDSPQKIYQTPEFFSAVRAAGEPDVEAALLALVTRDGTIAGIIPLLRSGQALRFSIGPLTLLSISVPVIRLLGSIPAAPTGVADVERVARRILALFPDARAIHMQALPQQSPYWRALAGISAKKQALATAVMGNWRDCHIMPLPASHAAYLDKFSAKKRYNLKRQIRQLEQHSGPLALTRVVQACQVAPLLRTLSHLQEVKLPASETMLTLLAEQGLLLCYELRGADEVLAVIVGTRSPQVLHIHNIFVTDAYRTLSVGTSALHLVVEDVISQAGIGAIDFGYGTPGHQFASSHVLGSRAQVLLFERAGWARFLFLGHSAFVQAAEALVDSLKRLRKHWRRQRQQAQR